MRYKARFDAIDLARKDEEAIMGLKATLMDVDRRLKTLPHYIPRAMRTSSKSLTARYAAHDSRGVRLHERDG